MITRRTILSTGAAALIGGGLAHAATPDLGRLDAHPAFASRFVRPRDVWVWLPPGYDGGRPLPVLYMHDGQNLFDPKRAAFGVSWQIDTHVSALARRGIGPAIVVGIANTPLRWREYGPASILRHLPAATRARIAEGYGGPPLSAAYLRFIVDELKPWVDRRYRTLPSRDHTFLMGSSMGGLISLEGLARHPDVFGGAACLSSHLALFAVDPRTGAIPTDTRQEEIETALAAFARDDLPAPGTHRIWLDHGTAGLDRLYGPLQDALVTALKARGYREGNGLAARTYEGADHNETSWSARVEQPLAFLLDPGSSPTS